MGESKVTAEDNSKIAEAYLEWDSISTGQETWDACEWTKLFTRQALFSMGVVEVLAILLWQRNKKVIYKSKYP